MKLSSKLPKRNGLVESDLPADLLEEPTRTRLLVVEVACGKTETTFDEYGDPFTVPTAQVVSAEYVNHPDDVMAARVIARRAFDRRRGADTLPGVDGAAILRHGKGLLTATTVDIDPATGEVLDGGDES